MYIHLHPCFTHERKHKGADDKFQRNCPSEEFWELRVQVCDLQHLPLDRIEHLDTDTAVSSHQADVTLPGSHTPFQPSSILYQG